MEDRDKQKGFQEIIEPNDTLSTELRSISGGVFGYGQNASVVVTKSKDSYNEASNNDFHPDSRFLVH